MADSLIIGARVRYLCLLSSGATCEETHHGRVLHVEAVSLSAGTSFFLLVENLNVTDVCGVGKTMVSIDSAYCTIMARPKLADSDSDPYRS